MKFIFYLFLFVAVYATDISDVETDEGVLVLTDENFEMVITAQDLVLVEFYAPWCGHCKALAPEYVKAAGQLKDAGSTALLAKLDATQNTKVAEKFEVRGYPTLKLFRSGSPSDYSGGRTADEIVSWISKKTGPAAVELKTLESLKKAIEVAQEAKGQLAVVAVLKSADSENEQVFSNVAEIVEDVNFFVVHDSAVGKEVLESGEGIVIYRSFDENKLVYEGDYSLTDVQEFVEGATLPLIVEFTQESASKIFGGSIKSQLLMFIPKSHPEHNEKVDLMRVPALEFKNKALFIHINTEEEENKRIQEFFGIVDEDLPTIRFINLGPDMKKFKMDGDLTTDNIAKFTRDFFDGNLKPFLMTDDVPEEWDSNPVKVLVGKNFEEVALDKTKNVFVEFYAPWCGHCKQLAPIWDDLASKMADSETEVAKETVIAKMDSTTNEAEGVSISSFPTLRYFKKDTNEMVEYKGARTLDALQAFVESGGTDVAGVGDEEDEEEDDEEYYEEGEYEESEDESDDEHTKDEL